MENLPDLQHVVGPVADKVTIWPHEDGNYGVDATFYGVSGFEDLARHEEMLKHAGATYSLRQELDRGWTIRFGPISHRQALQVVEAFIV